jgi:osmoprotectant transport system substrate-binding protein
MRYLRAPALLLCLTLLLLAACGASEDPTMGGGPGDRPAIVIGAKQVVTEDRLLGTMTAQLLEFKGIPVEYRELKETDNVRKALTGGQLDLYWEYTGTALSGFFGIEEVISDPQQAWRTARDRDAANGIVWLAPAPLNDANGLAVRSADRIGTTMSALAEWAKANPGARWCILNAFRTRPDGMPQLEKVYGIKPANVRTFDGSGPMFQGLERRQCDVIQIFTTDARLLNPAITPLEDDRRALPVYNPAPTVRKPVADAYPELEAILKPLTDKLDTKTMTTLNGKVDVDLLPVDKVAADFLSASGLR